MKLIITANTWEEEVRNAIIRVIDNRITLSEFRIHAAKIAKAIAKNELERATDLLWMYSQENYKKEHLQKLINELHDTYENEA